MVLCCTSLNVQAFVAYWVLSYQRGGCKMEEREVEAVPVFDSVSTKPPVAIG